MISSMNKFGLIFLLTLVGLLSCESRELEQPLTSADHHHNPTSTSASLSAVKFKDLILALTWPPSYCKSIYPAVCAQTPERFTVRGLWPQKTGDAGPNELTDNILYEYKEDLLEYWPDLEHKDFESSMNFWRDQYYKHGVYCTNKISAIEYFASTLTYAKFLQPSDWLSEKGIKPDAHQKYKVSEIVAAINSSIGYTPDLQCFVDNDKNAYVVEVRFCLHENLYFIDCPGRLGRCSNTTYAYYPPASAVKKASDHVIEKIEELGIYEVV